MLALKLCSRYNRLIISWPVFLILLLALIQRNDGATLTFATNVDNSAIFAYNITTAMADNAAESNNDVLEFKLQDQPAITTKDTKANLTAITWAHAVNSQQELNDALSSDIDMIEADIVLGKINGSGADLPVMAHPPANSSDITLEEFLRQIMTHNDKNMDQSKGIKLDFKSIEVFEGSLEILKAIVPTMTYPLWLNADIVRGPVNQTTTIPVDPERFFAGCAQFEKAVLSIGWTTKWGANYTDGAYTTEEIDDMLHAIKNNNVTVTKQPITFPVRAGIAANSRDQLHDLVRSVNDTNDSTLTIWSSDNDNVDVNKLRELILSFGIDRVYLDVPDELANNLDLGRGNGSPATISALVSFSVISVCLLAASTLIGRTKL